MACTLAVAIQQSVKQERTVVIITDPSSSQAKEADHESLGWGEAEWLAHEYRVISTESGCWVVVPQDFLGVSKAAEEGKLLGDLALAGRGGGMTQFASLSKSDQDRLRKTIGGSTLGERECDGEGRVALFCSVMIDLSVGDKTVQLSLNADQDYLKKAERLAEKPLTSQPAGATPPSTSGARNTQLGLAKYSERLLSSKPLSPVDRLAIVSRAT